VTLPIAHGYGPFSIAWRKVDLFVFIDDRIALKVPSIVIDL
jgi:hypothetical protein